MTERPLWQLILEARESAGECPAMQVAKELRVVIAYLRGCSEPLSLLSYAFAEAYVAANEAAPADHPDDR